MKALLSFLRDVAREPVVALRAGWGSLIDWLRGEPDDALNDPRPSRRLDAAFRVHRRELRRPARFEVDDG